MSEVTYENIICEKSHNGQECSFSDKASTKIKMLITIAVISAFSVVTFSGCTNIKKDIEQLTTTKPQTSYVQMMEETTTTRPIIEATTQTVTQLTTQENTTQKETQQATTTKPVEQTTVIVTKQEAEETTKKVEQTQNIDKEYNKLFEQLNEELNKKNFSVESNKLFIDTFERLYKNYSSWENGYKDLPSREEYIKTNLIDIIKEIDDVKFYDEDSKEGKQLLEEGSPSAWTEYSENNKKTIGIIAKSADKANEEKRNEDVELFFHEVAHCKQKEDTFYVEYTEGDDRIPTLAQLYLEGDATFHMKFTNPLTTASGGSWTIENEEGNSVVEYNKENCLGYLIELNAYEKIVYLAGYNTMQKVQKGELPLTAIKNTIAEKYGQENAEEIITTMEEWYLEYNNNWQGNEVYNLAVKLENIFLGLVKQDIKNDSEKSKKAWEHYKTKNLPQVYDENYKNITSEVFDIQEIENQTRIAYTSFER